MTERRFTFDKIASLYQSARPDYPEALFDDITAGLNPGASSKSAAAAARQRWPLRGAGFPFLPWSPERK